MKVLKQSIEAHKYIKYEDKINAKGMKRVKNML